jgi:hypothetical protein
MSSSISADTFYSFSSIPLLRTTNLPQEQDGVQEIFAALIQPYTPDDSVHLESQKRQEIQFQNHGQLCKFIMKIAAHIAVNNSAHSEETNGHKTLGKHLPDQNSNLSYAGTYTSAQVLEDLSSHTMTQPVSNVVFRRTTNPMHSINEPSTNNKVRIFTTQEQTHNRGRQTNQRIHFDTLWAGAATALLNPNSQSRHHCLCLGLYALQMHLGVVFIKPHHLPLGSIFIQASHLPPPSTQ